MKTQDVLKKLNKKLQKKKEQLLNESKKLARQNANEYFDPKVAAESKIKAASRLSARTISGLTYKIRNNYFENGRGTCGFDPETFEGHSYTWYSLVKMIKGQVVLNTYRYSSQTSIHIDRVREILTDLNIKYIELLAPRGLQNLEAARSHELTIRSESLVREKYARIKSKRYVNQFIRESDKRLVVLTKFGCSTTQAMRRLALEQAENDRKAHNERLRKRSAEKRAVTKLEIVFDPLGDKHDLSGHHIVDDAEWNWNNNAYVGRINEWSKLNAVREGQTRLIVHKTEKRHLALVRA